MRILCAIIFVGFFLLSAKGCGLYYEDRHKAVNQLMKWPMVAHILLYWVALGLLREIQFDYDKTTPD